MKAIAFSVSVRYGKSLFQSIFRISVIMISFLSYTLISVSAQEHECGYPFNIGQHKYKIGFGESIQVSVNNQTGKNAEWTVHPSRGVSAAQGIGDVAEGLQFSEPGIYKVTFVLQGDREHVQTATVEVSGINMRFNTKSITLSKPMVKGVSVDGTTLTIKVDVKTANKKEIVEYQSGNSSSTGILGITATMDGPVKLRNGSHDLTFHLSGTPMYSGTAQLGFFNPLGEGFFYNFLIAE